MLCVQAVNILLQNIHTVNLMNKVHYFVLSCTENYSTHHVQQRAVTAIKFVYHLTKLKRTILYCLKYWDTCPNQ